MFDFPNAPSVGATYTPIAGGPTWRWDGTVWAVVTPIFIADAPSDGVYYARRNAAWAAVSPGTMIERYYSATSTWTKPAGLQYLEIEGTAPGGSGSAAVVTGAGVWSFGASGGAGAYGKRLIDAASLPASVTVTIGAAGAPSAAGGNTGGTTSFGSIVTLPGGTGGAQGANTTSTGSAITAQSSAPTGTDVGYAGAGSDYTTVNTASLSWMGRSGCNQWGGPSPWIMITATSGLSSQVGQGYGSGSSGCINPPSVAAKSSVAGQPGFIRVREYY